MRCAFWHTAVHSSWTNQFLPLFSTHLYWQWELLIWWLYMMASFTMEIVDIFHSGYLDYRDPFQIGFDSYSSVTDKEVWWILHFQMIFNITGAHGTTRMFHSGYLDYKGGFQAVFDSYCCVVGWTLLTTKCNGYFTFQVNFNITGVHGTFYVECLGSPVNYKKF